MFMHLILLVKICCVTVDVIGWEWNVEKLHMIIDLKCAMLCEMWVGECDCKVLYAVNRIWYFVIHNSVCNCLQKTPYCCLQKLLQCLLHVIKWNINYSRLYIDMFHNTHARTHTHTHTHVHTKLVNKKRCTLDTRLFLIIVTFHCRYMLYIFLMIDPYYFTD